VSDTYIMTIMELSIIQKVAIWALPVIFAITVHEVAHGWVASKFGDQTARFAGRLTLNPISHIDIFGTVIIPVALITFGSHVLFGWAKPVPVDPRNLSNPRRDMALVALAGPGSNLIMAMLWALVAKLSTFAPPWFAVPLESMGWAGIQINIMLGVLNLLPIPPLDGGQFVSNVLRGKIAYYYSKIEPYGFLILLALIFTNVIFYILYPPIIFLIKLIVTMFGLR